jgi:hypothetical protein
MIAEPSPAFKGSCLGGVLGGLLGVVVGGLITNAWIAQDKPRTPWYQGVLAALLAPLVVAIGAGIGGIIGAVVGSAVGAGVAAKWFPPSAPAGARPDAPSSAVPPAPVSTETEVARLKERIAELEQEKRQQEGGFQREGTEGA